MPNLNTRLKLTSRGVVKLAWLILENIDDNIKTSSENAFANSIDLLGCS